MRSMLAVTFLAALIGCNPFGGTPTPTGTVAKPNLPPALVKVGIPPDVPPPNVPPAPPPAVLDWSKIGDKAKVGEIDVELLWVGVTTYSMRVRGQVHQQCATSLQFELANKSVGKIQRFEGWNRRKVKLADEHGNEFKIISPDGDFVDHPYPGGMNAAPKLEWPFIIAADLPLHPGKAYGTYLMFEKAPPTTKELRFTGDAEALGGTGEVRFRIPLKYRNPRCDDFYK